MEQLPPGFRFYPTEEELVSFYLHNKLHSQKPELDRVIPSIDIYNFEPSRLPEQASQVCDKDHEQWFFFMPQQEREARGGRPTRTTTTGYWKATGSRSYVYSSKNKMIGVKKTRVFYYGKAPSGTKTKWKMNEYVAVDQENNVFDSNASASAIPKLRKELSLCRIYVTSGCARAFDRRPGGTRRLNDNIISACDYNLQRDDIGQGNGSSDTQNDNNAPTKTNLTEDCGGTQQGVATVQGNNNPSYDDVEMLRCLDTLIDLDQLGWL